MKKIFRITALVLLLTFSLSLLTGCMNGFLKDFFEKYFGKISELPIPGSSSSFVSEPVGSSSEVTSSGIVSSSVVPEPEPDPEEPAEVFRPEPEEEVDVMFPVETASEETLAEFKARMKDMCLYEFTAHGNLEEAKILIAENLLEELLK